MKRLQPDSPTADRYRVFADVEAKGMCAVYEDWALGISGDAEVVALIDELPPPKRQVNLVFSAAKYLGAPEGGYAQFRRWLLRRWPDVKAVALLRATQTNEPARLGPMLPLLAGFPQPLALLEVGASAGLCLFPDRYSYRYDDGNGNTRQVDPPAGQSTAVFDCGVSGPVPLPTAVPEVIWRAGIDLNPLDVNEPEDAEWLRALVWPGRPERERNLAAAIDIVRADRPRIVRGDLNEELAALAAQAPAEATLVVFHTAVLAYLTEEDATRFADTVRHLPGHWISYEGSDVTPGVSGTAAQGPTDPTAFTIALDGRAVAYAQPHGASVQWL